MLLVNAALCVARPTCLCLMKFKRLDSPLPPSGRILAAPLSVSCSRAMLRLPGLHPKYMGSEGDHLNSSMERPLCRPGLKPYLVYFRHRMVEFRVPEVLSVAAMLGCKPEDVNPRPAFPSSESHADACYLPFWLINLPSDAFAREVAARCILVRVGVTLELTTPRSRAVSNLTSLKACYHC